MNSKGNNAGLTSRVKESAVFLKRFVSRPRQVGSVMPSSPFLTKAMMSKIDWTGADNIAELGAGTGVFTRAIVPRLKPEGKVFVFEIDPQLKAMIEKENHGLTVYGDARELPEIIGGEGVRQLDYIISSLPYAVLPSGMTESILKAVDKCLKPGGKFIAYQYSTHMRKNFEKMFESVKISFVPLNFPPAFVYECTKGS